MPEIKTIADFWDCEIEHSEVKQMWVNDNLFYIICINAGRWNPTNFDVKKALREMAAEQAVNVQNRDGDRILDFVDGSRLGLVELGASTMKGTSRVMDPDDTYLRLKVRGDKPYIHGVTRSAWYWTTNGKIQGNIDPVSVSTNAPCPKDGLWVRRLCEKGCSGRGRNLWADRFNAGTSMPYCATCGSLATFRWAHP